MRPAKAEDVDAVLELVSPQVKAMIELESLTGMRPGETRIMRAADIDMSDPALWVSRHTKPLKSSDRFVIPLRLL